MRQCVRKATTPFFPFSLRAAGNIPAEKAKGRTVTQRFFARRSGLVFGGIWGLFLGGDALGQVSEVEPALHLFLQGRLGLLLGLGELLELHIVAAAGGHLPL